MEKENIIPISSADHTVLTSDLFGHFGNVFNKLCDIPTLPPMVKYNLAKVKKDLVEYAKAVETSLKEASKLDQDEKIKENERLMKEEFTFRLNPINIKDVAALSANDIYALKSLIVS